MKRLTAEDLLKIRTALQESSRLCRNLDDDSRLGEVQRRCLTEDIRTRRQLRNLSRRAIRLSRLLDERIYED